MAGSEIENGEKENSENNIPSYVGIGIGIICFVYFAMTRPIFGNILLDIPLFLLLGLVSVIVFHMVFFVATLIVGVDAIVRQDRVRPLGVFVIVAGSFIAAAFVLWIAHRLSQIV